MAAVTVETKSVTGEEDSTIREEQDPKDMTLQDGLQDRSEVPRQSDGEKTPLWSDQSDTAQGVIWGEQISNTIRKLKSLTFFAVGAKPQPPPAKVDVAENKGLDEKNKRKGKGTGKARKPRQSKRKGGSSPAQGMGSEETPAVAPDDNPPVPEPVFGLNDVANYECLSAEGDKVDIKESLELTVQSPSQRTEENDKHRRRRSNANGEKPNTTYTEIITTALEENPNGLTVSEIYDYISKRYGYYQPNDDRWKNSVRHNLSISPYFHKGSKSTHGAGHVWTLAEDCHDIRLSRRRFGSGLIPKEQPEKDKNEMTVSNPSKPLAPGRIDMTKLKTETDFAVASILGDYTRACNEGDSGYSEPDLKPHEESPPPSLGLASMSGFPSENHSFANGGNALGFNTLDCKEIEFQFEGIESYVNSSEAETQVISMEAYGTGNLCALEDGDLIDVEAVDEGMIINLNSYFRPEELQAIFMDSQIEPSAT